MSNTTDHPTTNQTAKTEAAGVPPELVRLEEAPKGPWHTRIKTWHRVVIVAVEFLVIFGLWELLVGRFEIANPIFMPPPSRIFEGFMDMYNSGEFWPHLRRSAYSYSVGYTGAVIVGIPMGLLVGTSVVAYRLTGPLIWSLYATPWIALMPMATIWFGFGAAPVMFIIFIASFFPIMLNTAAGPQTVDRSLVHSAEVFGASKFVMFRKIILPASLPFIFIGMRLAIVIAMIGMMVAEIVGSSVGLGALIKLKSITFKIGASFSVIVVAVIITTILGLVLKSISTRVAPWHFSDTEE
jgi:NitT/TauT family transport system permease protein